jgi:hypothetical protein
MPGGELPMNGDNSDDRVDADRLEEQWKRALDTASEAVSVGSRSNALPPSDAASAGEHIREERSWLNRFSPTLHKLFPGRRRSKQPSDPG